MANTGGRPKANLGSNNSTSSRPKANLQQKSNSSRASRVNGDAGKRARMLAEENELDSAANVDGALASDILFTEPIVDAPKVEELPKEENTTDVAPNPDILAVPDDDLLVVDDDLQEKKKKKKKGAYIEDTDLSGKKKRKKRKLLWLLLLLLLLFIILVIVFKDFLFPPKPIVVEPDQIVIEIKSTGQNAIGAKEYIFKPGDTIEFEEPISIYSPEYIIDETDNNKKIYLSPFTMRMRFFIRSEGLEYPTLLKSIEYAETGLFESYNDWLYLNEIVKPGIALELVTSVHLSDSIIGNEWQDKNVELCIEYQTVYPKNTEDIVEAFDGEFPPGWDVYIIDMLDRL